MMRLLYRKHNTILRRHVVCQNKAAFHFLDSISTSGNHNSFCLRSGSGSPSPPLRADSSITSLRLANVEDQNFPKTNTSFDFFKDIKLRFLNFKKHKYLQEREHFQTLSELQSPKIPGFARLTFLDFNLEKLLWSAMSQILSLHLRYMEHDDCLLFTYLVNRNCAGIQALMSMEENNKSSSFVEKWVGKAEVARLRTEAEASDLSFDQQCKHCEKVSIKHSLHNLLSYPWIKERVRKEILCIHGGYYDFVNCTFEKWTLDSNTYSPKGFELWC